MTSDPAARHTGQQPPPSWWRRNRVALVALLPMLALALAASSFRYVSIYRPTTFVAGQVATGSTGRFLAPVPGAEPPTTRDVSITLVSATPHASSGDLSAAKGTRLWEVELEFASGCPLDRLHDRTPGRRWSGLWDGRGQAGVGDRPGPDGIPGLCSRSHSGTGARSGRAGDPRDRPAAPGELARPGGHRHPDLWHACRGADPLGPTGLRAAAVTLTRRAARG